MKRVKFSGEISMTNDKEEEIALEIGMTLDGLMSRLQELGARGTIKCGIEEIPDRFMLSTVEAPRSG